MNNLSLLLNKEQFKTNALLESSLEKIILIGNVDSIVEYSQLEYLFDKSKVEERVQEILSSMLNHQEYHLASELDGLWLIILMDKKERVTRIITSNNYTTPFYYREKKGRLYISDDADRITSDINKTDINNYSISNLRYLDSAHGCIPGESWLISVFRLLPSMVYYVGGSKLRCECVVATHCRAEYSYDDFDSVIGKKLSQKHSYGVAYSSGIDSHHLFEKFSSSVAELGTARYSSPHLGITKLHESAAALITANIRSKQFTDSQTDFNSPICLEYFSDYVRNAPFTRHSAVHFYKLIRDMSTEHILTGQNADAVIFWSGTAILLKPTGVSTLRMFIDQFRLRNRMRVAYDVFDKDYNYAKSYYREIYDQLGGCLDQGGYSPFLYYKLINYFTGGDVQSWVCAAKYNNKSIYFPYSEPLALHVSNYLKRSMFDIINPKKHFRDKYDYLKSDDIPRKLNNAVITNEPSLLEESLSENIEKLYPYFKKKVDSLVSGKVQRMVLYQYGLNSHREL